MSIQLNFVSKKELNSFKDGANVQAAFIYDDVSEGDFVSNTVFSDALEIYDKSSIHNAIVQASEILSNNINDYNKDEVSAVIDSIANMDADLYQIIIYFIHAALQQKDINSRKEYFNKLKEIIEVENASIIENTKESKDVAVEEVATEKESSNNEALAEADEPLDQHLTDE